MFRRTSNGAARRSIRQSAPLSATPARAPRPLSTKESHGVLRASCGCFQGGTTICILAGGQRVYRGLYDRIGRHRFQCGNHCASRSSGPATCYPGRSPPRILGVPNPEGVATFVQSIRGDHDPLRPAWNGKLEGWRGGVVALWPLQRHHRSCAPFARHRRACRRSRRSKGRRDLCPAWRWPCHFPCRRWYAGHPSRLRADLGKL